MQVTKKMSSMVKAGLPVVETIEILKGQAKSYGMKYVLKTIHRDLNSGVTISDAFAKQAQKDGYQLKFLESTGLVIVNEAS